MPLRTWHAYTMATMAALRQPVMVLLALIGWLLLHDQHLAADGIEHLRLTLENRGIFAVAEGRYWAYWLTQWFVALGLAAGVEELRTFIGLYALGIFLLYALPWYLACLRLHGLQLIEQFSLVYGLGLGLLCLPSAYLLGTEHQVVFPLTMLAGVLLVGRRSDSSPGWDVLLLLCVFLLGRSYETSVVALGMLLVIAALVWHRSGHSTGQRLVFVVFIGLCLYGMYQSAQGILQPRDAGHRDGFLAQMLPALRNPVLLSAALCAAALGLGQRWRIAAWAMLGIATGWQAWCLSHPQIYADVARLSFASRTLSTVVPAAGLLLLTIHFRRRLQSHHAWIAMLLIMFSALQLTAPFRDFKREVQRVAHTHNGIVPAERHALGQHPAAWFWTFPNLSIAWQAQCVGAVLTNPYANQWQPYDPAQTPGFTQYVRWGVNLYPERNDLHRCAASIAQRADSARVGS